MKANSWLLKFIGILLTFNVFKLFLIIYEYVFCVIFYEILRWIGAPLKQQLNTLKPVQITELEVEFNNLKEEKVVPTRFLKSQKPKSICIVDSISENGEGKNIISNCLI